MNPLSALVADMLRLSGTIDSSPEPPIEIQIATLIVTSLAAVAAIVAAVVSGVLASRRDKLSWLRTEQVATYDAFSAAAKDLVRDLSDGSVGRALQLPGLDGLDDAYEDVLKRSGSVFNAARRVAVFGGKRSGAAVGAFVAEMDDLRDLACPVPHAVHAASLDQRREANHRLSYLEGATIAAMRADLGLIGRRRYAKLTRSLREHQSEGVLAPRDPATAHNLMFTWMVFCWDYSIPDPKTGWLRSDAPWVTLNRIHQLLNQPLVAVLTKGPDRPWRAAISSHLTDHQVAEIEADMIRLVRYGGRGDGAIYGGQRWVPGQAPGEQVWFWPTSRLPQPQPYRPPEPSHSRRRGSARTP